MKHERIDISYVLDFQTAFHMGTGLRNGLIHRGIARDPDGFLFVPGSTIKGVLRDRATLVANTLDLDVGYPHETADLHDFAVQADITALIFGSRFRPGTLFFDDAKLRAGDQALFDPPQRRGLFKTKQVEIRTQVSMSRMTGTARHQFLFNSEYGVPTIRFEGQITGLLSGTPMEQGMTTYSGLLLLAALAYVDGLGGSKSSGAGHVACTVTTFSVDGVQIRVDDVLALLPDFEYYHIAVELEEDTSN